MAVGNDGPAILAAFWAPFTIAFLTFCARMISRIKYVRAVGPDDWVMVFAMVSTIHLTLFSRHEEYRKIDRNADSCNSFIHLHDHIYPLRLRTTRLRADAPTRSRCSEI